MKRFILTTLLCLALATLGTAQQSSPDSPATKEDVERYLEITHARNTMKQMMDVMAKQTHQMVHQQISKDIDKLPPDFETRVNKMTDDMLKDLPLDEMLQATIPV